MTETTNATTLPPEFASLWVGAMLATVLGVTDGDADGAAEALGDLDRQSGDGDFGSNLTSAFTRVRGEIESTSPTTYPQWLTAVSRGFLGTGGTSGPLFGMFFRDLARCTTASTPTLTELASGLRSGLAYGAALRQGRRGPQDDGRRDRAGSGGAHRTGG